MHTPALAELRYLSSLSKLKFVFIGNLFFEDFESDGETGGDQKAGLYHHTRGGAAQVQHCFPKNNLSFFPNPDFYIIYDIRPRSYSWFGDHNSTMDLEKSTSFDNFRFWHISNLVEVLHSVKFLTERL